MFLSPTPIPHFSTSVPVALSCLTLRSVDVVHSIVPIPSRPTIALPNESASDALAPPPSPHLRTPQSTPIAYTLGVKLFNEADTAAAAAAMASSVGGSSGHAKQLMKAAASGGGSPVSSGGGESPLGAPLVGGVSTTDASAAAPSGTASPSKRGVAAEGSPAPPSRAAGLRQRRRDD